MNQEQVLEKISTLINETFDTEYIINDETSAEQIDEWDSISHIELISNIENSFGVRFGLGELQELKNVGDMATLVVSKL